MLAGQVAIGVVQLLYTTLMSPLVGKMVTGCAPGQDVEYTTMPAGWNVLNVKHQGILEEQFEEDELRETIELIRTFSALLILQKHLLILLFVFTSFSCLSSF
ncbi:unnamed protein product [Ilex paraguariensis]|uniref:Uncharacterized protein n=1 Tax=Ilex paraguariensis TaxID=185542 RepID=A0ABC8RQ90_9AQUA